MPPSFRWAAGLSHCRMRMGRELMNPVLGELGDRCTLLTATVQPLYESLGIKTIGTPFTSIRAQHACAVIREDQVDVTMWRCSHRKKAPQKVRIQPEMSSNDGGIIKQWGLAGLGVIIRSEWDVAEDLDQGRLVPLLSDWRLPDADVVALLGARGGRVARTAHFLEILTEIFQPVPWRVNQGMASALS